jgi:hypothetical protein
MSESLLLVLPLVKAAISIASINKAVILVNKLTLAIH